jgi:hypothetical protein
MKPIDRSLNAHQRGAATLVVVMVLFLVMALLAAYANRSLLFEQRIAASYSRASLAQEVAEGGVEWTLAQLNGTGADAACKPVDNGGTRFADRYLVINASDRRITPASANPVTDCARDVANAGWSCRCPNAGAAHTVRAAMPGNEPPPSFNVKVLSGDRSGTMKLKVLGCTDSVPDSCDGDGKEIYVSKNQLARTSLTVQVALVSAVRSPPAAPLVVRAGLVSTGDGLGLHNSDARSAGQLAIMGGKWLGMVESRLETVPGTAISQVVGEKDLTLGDPKLTADDVFKMFMGASVSRYPLHPALREVTCGGDCTDALETAYKAGQRILWVTGDLAIGANKVLGSLTDPVLIIATGDVALSGSIQINGMLVSIGHLVWDNVPGAASVINGIVLVGAGMETNGRMDILVAGPTPTWATDGYEIP